MAHTQRAASAPKTSSNTKPSSVQILFKRPTAYNCRRSIQPLHTNIFVTDHTLGIVRLQRESPFAKLLPAPTLRARRLVIFERHFPIDLHRHLSPAHDDVLRPPFVIPGRRQSDVHQPVKTPRLD